MVFKFQKSTFLFGTVCTLCMACLINGCSEQQSDDSSNQPVQKSLRELPEDWSQLSLSRIHSEGVLKTIKLTGKKRTFKNIVGALDEDLAKPVKFAADVDAEQSLKEFSFRVDDGSWTHLLSRVAEEFGCQVKETETEFLINSGE